MTLVTLSDLAKYSVAWSVGRRTISATAKLLWDPSYLWNG